MVSRIPPLLAAILSIYASSVLAFSSANDNNIVLVVGATGSMGRQAINGLLLSGLEPRNLRILSRDPSKLKDLEALGFGTLQADLNDVESLITALDGCNGCYIHATGNDTKETDSREVSQARHLAFAVSSKGDPTHVVYNSAVGEPEIIGIRKQQKQDIEEMFRSEFPTIDLTALRSNFFMDEVWKKYTRPGVLDGKFTFCVPPSTPIHLTAIADMGFIAGRCFQSPETTANRIINVAGDILTPTEMAAAFAKCQGSSCKHSRGRVMSLLARLFFKDLWDEIIFLRKTKVAADIEALKQEFGSVTSFEQFLDESGWSDPEKSYADFKLVVPEK